METFKAHLEHAREAFFNALREERSIWFVQGVGLWRGL